MVPSAELSVRSFLVLAAACLAVMVAFPAEARPKMRFSRSTPASSVPPASTRTTVPIAVPTGSARASDRDVPTGSLDPAPARPFIPLLGTAIPAPAAVVRQARPCQGSLVGGFCSIN